MNPGDKLGPYEIVEAIGQGGMGAVYRARDPRMGREVAIKVAAEQFSERFSREVHAIAALNHPNICTLYDVGPNYLVMELVEGATLAARITEGALPLDEALAIAGQIAAALEAAHDKGIVHRDLKPGNVMLKHDGGVKVLDFGLAKVSQPEVAVAGEDSPTLSMHATRAGVILGTAAYMAPEQARGKAVDKRADIWAFGVVVYEMVTGRRLFQGEDLTETLAAVVRDKADVSAAPAKLRRVLERCLEKDPGKRLRDISGFALLLEEGGTDSPPQAAGAPHRLAKFALAAAAVLLVAVGTLAMVHFGEAPPALQTVEFTIESPRDLIFARTQAAFAPSPDGRYIVYSVANPQSGAISLWLRALDSRTARQLPGTENSSFPAWSPDSRSLVFQGVGDRKLKRIEISGGAPVTLTDLPDSQLGPASAWNRDNVILFGGAEGLRRISASGGTASLLTKADPAAMETGHGFPQFLPDGNRFLYLVASSDPGVQGVYASSLDHPGQRTLVMRTAYKAVYVPPRGQIPGYLLWLDEEASLLAQPFNVDTLQREGDPFSVAEGIASNTAQRAGFWASESGLLIYFADVSLNLRPIIWFTRDGKQTGEAAPAGDIDTLALSPDARRLAIARSDPESASRNFDLWLRDFDRAVETRLTFDAAFEGGAPVWSPDGKWVTFVSERGGTRGIGQLYRVETSGGGPEIQLTDGPNAKIPLDWSRDGRYLLYRETSPETNRDVMAIAMEGERKPIPVAQTRFRESTAAFSPDGKWVAYASDDSGQNEIYIRAFPVEGAPTGRWQISQGGGYDVKWPGDGKQIYYLSPGSELMAATIRIGPQGIQPETPRMLFPVPGAFPGNMKEFDVTADGQRFLFVLTARRTDPPRLIVVANWQARPR